MDPTIILTNPGPPVSMIQRQGHRESLQCLQYREGLPLEGMGRHRCHRLRCCPISAYQETEASKWIASWQTSGLGLKGFLRHELQVQCIIWGFEALERSNCWILADSQWGPQGRRVRIEFHIQSQLPKGRGIEQKFNEQCTWDGLMSKRKQVQRTDLGKEMVVGSFSCTIRKPVKGDPSLWLVGVTLQQ